jgi:[NiFe] hydrogenase diaphorase moiety large subunit
MDLSTTVLTAILDRHQRRGERLMTILRETQEALGWLSPETLSLIADAIGWPRVKVESTAGFYSFFHSRPMGQYRVLFSDNFTDRMQGSQALMQALCKQLWLEPGRVSEDGLVSVDATSCTGMCDQGPAALVNYRAITRLTQARIEQMGELIRNHVPLESWPEEWFQVTSQVHRRDRLLDHGLASGVALKAAIARGQDALLEELKLSNLRGRGGAGFPAGQKWESCRSTPSEERVVVCNADEGEPGTFKDRILLTDHPDLVFEGMTIAAYTIKARRGFVYLRGEYRYLLETLEAVLVRRREAGLLGRNILGQGFDFDIEIVHGAGAYICGERSALVESLEGKPGRPRLRTWSLSVKGYQGLPTDVNNVETLANACLVAVHGGDWYREVGTAKSSGTKLVSISGDCARPGVYEYPYGVSVAQILADCGAEDTLAVQVSGASGTTLAQDEFGRVISFEDVPCGGALMVFNRHRDMLEMARHYSHFFAHESCGFCTPCRVGTAVNAKLMDKLAAGHGSPYDINELFKMHRLLQSASHCGLGSTATNVIHDTLTKFYPAYQQRMQSLDYEPSFNLDRALSQARQMTGRDDSGAHLSNTETP